MCRKRTISSALGILHLCGFEDLVSKITAQEIRCMKLNFSAERLGKLILHTKESKSGRVSIFKLHKDINIAVRGKIIPQGRAKNRKPLNVMTLAENGNFVFRYDEVFVHGFLYRTQPIAQYNITVLFGFDYYMLFEGFSGDVVGEDDLDIQGLFRNFDLVGDVECQPVVGGYDSGKPEFF